MQLARAGYFGGDPNAIMEAPVDLVQSMLEYERFEVDYEKEYIALNTPGQG